MFMCVFVLARKPPIAPLPLYQPLNSSASCSSTTNSCTDVLAKNEKQNLPKKPRPFDVENLILPNTSSQPTQKKTDESDCITLYPGITINSTKAPNESKPKCKELSINIKGNELSEVTYFDSTCGYLDRSAEVKHAQTPINTTLQETHSPQLPVPSPSYPIQTRMPSDSEYINNTITPEASSEVILIKNNSIKSEISKLNQETIIEIPTVNQSSSFWDLHLPNSNKEPKPVNSITIQDLLTTETNLPKKQKRNSNFIKEKCEIKSDQKFLGKFDNCVVLNVPSLVLQQQPPPLKKQKLSKIDLATQKRKIRRQKRHLNQINDEPARKIKKERVVYERIATHKGTVTDFGVQVFGYSDSSSSSSYSSSDYESDSFEADNVVSNSCVNVQLEMRPEKLKFLQLFGLTTFTKKNGELH